MFGDEFGESRIQCGRRLCACAASNDASPQTSALELPVLLQTAAKEELLALAALPVGDLLHRRLILG